MSATVGLPQGMLYHRYGLLWRTFFQELGIETVRSGQTTKEIMDRGAALCVDEACLSAKIFLGHVDALVGRCTYILVPRVSSFGHKRMMCTRFEAMPDIVRNVFRDRGQQFLHYDLDVNQHHDEPDAFLALGTALGCTKKAAKKAYAAAKKEERRRYKVRVASEEAL